MMSLPHPLLEVDRDMRISTRVIARIDDFPKSELAFNDLGPLADEKLSSVHLQSRNIAQNRPISPENLKISEGKFFAKIYAIWLRPKIRV